MAYQIYDPLKNYKVDIKFLKIIYEGLNFKKIKKQVTDREKTWVPMLFKDLYPEYIKNT